jgi:hypothetical protein
MCKFGLLNQATHASGRYPAATSDKNFKIATHDVPTANEYHNATLSIYIFELVLHENAKIT